MKIMPEIFARGKCNLIQLGNSNTAEAAVRSMNNTLDDLRSMTGDFKGLQNTVGPGAREDAKFKAPVYSTAPPSASIDTQAMIDLLSNVWFT